MWRFRRVLDRTNFEEGFARSDITVVNWPQNDYWLGAVVGVDPAEGARNLDAARQLSLSLLYWLQTEAPRPDGGIGYAVAKWTKDQKAASDLVRSLTSTDALKAFYENGGAIASDTTIDTAAGGPAVKTIVSEVKTGKPALHVALSSKTVDLMGRLSQQLLSGSITVDEVLQQLAASDKTG